MILMIVSVTLLLAYALIGISATVEAFKEWDKHRRFAICVIAWTWPFFTILFLAGDLLDKLRGGEKK